MIKIDRIHCPTDFSENAEHALNYGLELARKFNATIHLHHIVQVPYMAVAYEIGPDVAAAREMAENEGRRRLEKRVEELEQEGVRIEAHLTVGTPFVDIVTLAREKDIDLIVIGTHGWGALKQILLGSTAERVVRKAPCPVLTIKHPEHEFVMP